MAQIKNIIFVFTTEKYNPLISIYFYEKTKKLAPLSTERAYQNNIESFNVRYVWLPVQIV